MRCDFDSSHSQREEEGGRRSASAAALSFMNRKPDPYGRDATRPYHIPLKRLVASGSKGMERKRS